MKHLSLGTKIKSKGTTSPVAYGEIIGIEIGYAYYMNNMYQFPGLLENWRKCDPNWLHNPIYIVKKYLRDLPFFTDDEKIPVEAREKVKYEWEHNPSLVVRQRFIAYPSVEVEALPDDYDFVVEIEKEINQEKDV
jgi:hypothetical protein